MYPDANKERVIKENNSLRTCFRKVLKEVRELNKSGAGMTTLIIQVCGGSRNSMKNSQQQYICPFA
jgi:hypothetical protein